MSTAILQAPEYREWRDSIYLRDGRVCKRCGSTHQGYSRTSKAKFKLPMSAHHIWPRYKYPHLAYHPENGIVICGACHELMSGREEQFAPELLALINSSLTGDQSIPESIQEMVRHSILENHLKMTKYRQARIKANFKWPDENFMTLTLPKLNGIATSCQPR